MIKIEVKEKKTKKGISKYVELNNEIYSYIDETRGARDKFWLKREPSRIYNEPYYLNNILFKSNRNDVSCESWGELYASRIAEQINFDSVIYFLAKVKYKDLEDIGVMCGSFKSSESDMEMSVFDLQTMGEENLENLDPNKINCVSGILKDIKTFLGDSTLHKKYYKAIRENIRNELIKQAIFDFVLAQTDRHWYNTSFLINEQANRISFKKAQTYDSGCIAFLKRKAKAIETISNEIIKQGGINSPRIEQLLENYIPMFGINTPTTYLDLDASTPDNYILRTIKERKQTFLDELVDIILNEPEISLFYIKLKSDLNVDEITYKLNLAQDNPPKYIGDMIRLVSGYQIQQIDNLIHKKIREVNTQDENIPM